jgi:hypothetical protein
MIWRRNLDGAVWEMLNPDFLVCARLWVMDDWDKLINEAPYYLTFHPFGDLIGPSGNATPIIADDLEYAKDIAQAIYQLHDGDNIRRSKYAQP